MNDLTALLDRMRTQRPVASDQLPVFALYMDQDISRYCALTRKMP